VSTSSAAKADFVLSLRHPWVWAGLGWALVIGVVVGSLLPGRMMPTMSLSDKVQHAGAYFLLMIWFAGLYRRSVHPIIALVLLLLGTALDVLQGTTRTRSFDLYDIAADAVGIVAGLVLSFWLLEGWCQRLERGWAALRA
jgi:VanZ family protein